MRSILALALLFSSLGLSHAQPRAITAWLYADNYVELYVNGRLVVKDPIVFTPHNVVVTKFRASYPMTIAVLLKDFAHPRTGLEYNHSRIGDGGFIARFSNGVVTDRSWRCHLVSRGPVNRRCLAEDPARTCRVETKPVPKGWATPGFDDRSWPRATVHSERAVRPLSVYYRHKWAGAKFIWSPDLEIDNTVLCRKTVRGPQ
jgi:hypothetical protein